MLSQYLLVVLLCISTIRVLMLSAQDPGCSIRLTLKKNLAMTRKVIDYQRGDILEEPVRTLGYFLKSKKRK